MSCLEPNLINMVKNFAYEEVAHHLKELLHESEDQLSNALMCRDVGEMTPLHHAIKRCDIKMTKMLLDFGASIECKIRDQTVRDFAKELMKNGNEEKHKWGCIYALIKIRQKLQKRNGANSVFRSMKMIEPLVEKIKDITQKKGVLFLGISGEGKSTLINYFYGVDYKRENRKITPLSPEVVKTGHSMTSQTLLPEVVDLENSPYALIDLPGFEDTRGSATKICTDLSIHLIARKLHSIQAILLISSWNSLSDPKMLHYRKAAYHVGAMMSHTPLMEENVILVVTKPDKELIVKDVKERLMELAKAEGWVGSTSINLANVTAEEWKKHCVRKVTEGLLFREGNILLVDVTVPKLRNTFQIAMSQLEEKSKSTDQCDFGLECDSLRMFQDLLKERDLHMTELKDRHVYLLKSMESAKNSIDNKRMEIEHLTRQLDELFQRGQTKKRNQKKIDEKIYKSLNILKGELNQLTFSLSAKRESKKLLSANYSKLEKEIVTLETDSSEINKIIYSSDDMHCTSDLTGILRWLSRESAYRGAQYSLSNHGVVISEGTLIESSIEQLNYNLNVLFIKKKLAKLDWKENESFRVNVYKSQPRCDDPEYQRNLAKLRSKLESCSGALTDCQKGIFDLEDQIRQKELEIAKEEMKVEEAKQNLKMEKTLFAKNSEATNQEIAKLNIEVLLLQSEQEKITRKKLLCEEEFVINETLFPTDLINLFSLT